MDVFYKTHDPAAGAAQLEAMIRHDLGTSEPVPYRIVGVQGASKHPKLYDAALRGLGGTPAGLYTIEFDLPGHRQALLVASMLRHADWAYCGSLAYSIRIGRRLAEQIGFEKRKALVVGPRFVGGEAAAKLNAVPGLAGRADKVLEKSMLVGGGTLEQKPVLIVVPDEGGAWLMIKTLLVVKPSLRTSKGTSNAGKILQIAADIESAL